MTKIIPVILSGGFGTRLWPLSRKQYPKQYLSLASDNTMLQDTLLRLRHLENVGDPIIVCNTEHRFIVAEQLKEIHIDNPDIMLEPVGKNSAPAITAAAFQVIHNRQNDDALLLVLSADHVIRDIVAFHKAIQTAAHQANNGKLVTFGIKPSKAHTGYGYIQIKELQKNKSLSLEFYEIEKFIEKPNSETATQYFESGNFLWNSGMFLFKANVFIKELTCYSPEIVQAVEKSVIGSIKDLEFIRLEKSAFNLSPSNSVDCALMEKTNNAVVVPLDAGWSDIGSWSALYDIAKKDESGNVIKGNVIAQDVRNVYIHAENRMIATIGIENLIIVDTPDVTLVATKDKSQEITRIVKELKYQKKDEILCHRKVYRPWGWYNSIDTGSFFQVKRLHINPGASISLQRHHYRSEHWVVVEGSAKVTCGEKVFILEKNESTYIPMKTKHRLENIGNDLLEIIEVQTGEYLGEDDIERFDDDYGRH